MWVQSLGWEDPLEEGIATYSSILKGLYRRISQVLGVKLGTGPQTFCSGYSS